MDDRTEDDTLRPEYDFSSGVRGKHHHAYRQGIAVSVNVRLRRMRAVAERCATLVDPGLSSAAHGEILYDERGLPKRV